GLEALLGPEAGPEPNCASNGEVAEQPTSERSIVQRLKHDPGRTSVDSVVTEVAKLQQIRQLGLPPDLFPAIAPTLLTAYPPPPHPLSATGPGRTPARTPTPSARGPLHVIGGVLCPPRSRDH